MTKPRADKRGRASETRRRRADIKERPERNQQLAEQQSTAVVARLVADLTPDDAMPDPLPLASSLLGLARSNTLGGRVTVVNAYLDANPDERQAIESDITQAWSRARGKRADYLAAVAEKRAELESRARLYHSATAAPQAARDLIEGLAEYLAGPEQYARDQ